MSGTGNPPADFTPAPDGDPWDPQPGEPGPAFAAFEHYLEFGASRTLKAVAGKVGVDYSQVKRWSRRWGWRVRVGEWDEYQARRRRKLHQDELDQMTQRHVSLAVGQLSLGTKVLQSQLAAWKQWEDTAGQNPRPPPPEMKIADLVKLIKAGIAEERVARGEPETLAEVNHSMDADDKRRALRKYIGDPVVRQGLGIILEGFEPPPPADDSTPED